MVGIPHSYYTLDSLICRELRVNTLDPSHQLPVGSLLFQLLGGLADYGTGIGTGVGTGTVQY